jgi:riboflavin kinase/FMN adenylyltransferase
MKVLTWDEFIQGGCGIPAPGRPGQPRGSPSLAATIGVFDGIHLGHRRLMDSVLARKPDMIAAVITFKDSPKKILHPQNFKGDIFSLERKIQVFDRAGFDLCVLIDFSRNFGTLSGAEFLGFLAAAQVKFLCIGPNFRCGHKMDTNAQMLVKVCAGLGVEATIAEPVLYNGHPVSSSRIRNAILEGRMGEATDMLGRPHDVDVVRFRDGSGRLRSMDCIMEAVPGSLLPPEGSYRIVVDPDGSSFLALARVDDGLIAVGDPDTGASLCEESLGEGETRRLAFLHVVSQE